MDRPQMQSFTSVPFKNESGMTHVHGMAKFSSAGVVLEYEGKFFGLVSKGMKEGRVPIADILDVKFRKGVLRRGAKIEIRLKTFSNLKDLPNEDGKVVLRVSSDDWEVARDAVARLQKDLAEHAASLPPPPTSVRSIFEQNDEEG